MKLFSRCLFVFVLVIIGTQVGISKVFAARVQPNITSVTMDEGGDEQVVEITLDEPIITPIEGDPWVTINISSDNSRVQVSPASVVFLDTEWHEVREFTITTIGDSIPNADNDVTITLSAVSDSEYYSGFENTVSVTLVDDEAGPFSGAGAGVDGDPYIITSCAQLIEVNNFLGAYFQLDGGITGGILDCTASGDDIMIGALGYPFTGNFDGNSIKVNIDIEIGDDYAGLFRYVDGATIASLGLGGTVVGTNYVGGLVGYAEDADIDVSYSQVNVTGSGEFIGGFAGYIYGGLVTNSYATGVVIGGTENTGGFVGEVDGGAAVTYSYSIGNVTTSDPEGIDIGGFAGDIDNSTVAFSYATGDVSGVSYVGGFVGDSDTNAVILYSYSSGRVEGTEDKIGGFIGDAVDGVTITDSYTLSLVEGVDEVGGFVGNIENSTLEHVYSAGSSVIGETRVGGLVGDDDGGNTFTMTFFDTETSGLENACGEGGCLNVVGETTENMKDADTFNPYSEEEYGFSLEDPALYRYIKWEILTVRDGGDTDCSTGDVCTQASEFRPTIHGFSALTLIADVTATNPGGVNISGLVAGYLLDDDTSTKFIDGAFSTSNNSNGSSVVIFDAGDGNQVDFNGYNWATGNDMITRDPVSWTVSGSNDGISYTLLDTQTDYSPTASRESWIGELNENWDFYQIWGIDGEGVNNVGYPFLQFQGFDYEYSAPVDPADGIPPTVFATYPEDASTGMPRNVPITISFSEAIDAHSANISMGPCDGACPSFEVELDSETVLSIVVTDPDPLAAETEYTITINSIDDHTGTAMAEPYSFSFTTGAEVDETAPVLTEVQVIKSSTTIANAVYHFDNSESEGSYVFEECSGGTPTETILDAVAHTVRLSGILPGYTYGDCSFWFYDLALNQSNELHLDSFTVVRGGSGGGGYVSRLKELLVPEVPVPAPVLVAPLERLLKFGMMGEDVRMLQQLLNKKGFVLAASGAGAPGLETPLFGPKTLVAVKKFQLANGLTPDGIVGPLTWGLLTQGGL